MKKECKRHQWRIGAGIGGYVNGKIKTIGINIWCWRCGKVIKAYDNINNIKLRYKKRKYAKTNNSKNTEGEQ